MVVSQVRREVAIFSKSGSIVDGAKHHLKDCRYCRMRSVDGSSTWTHLGRYAEVYLLPVDMLNQLPFFYDKQNIT